MLKTRKKLRAPCAISKPGYSNWHYGVIIETTGDSDENSRKEKNVYLYSKTINRDCGKLLCSMGWKDFHRGQWVYFNTKDDENFFKSELINSPYPTEVNVNNDVEVKVRLFVIPEFISDRYFNNWIKFWSPEMGLVYSDIESVNKMKISSNHVYKAWISWALTPACFNHKEIDPYNFPYEPTIYWRLHWNRNINEIECMGNINDIPDEVQDLRILAKHQTQYEIMCEYFYRYNCLPTKVQIKAAMPKDNENFLSLNSNGRRKKLVSCGADDNVFGVMNFDEIHMPPNCELAIHINSQALCDAPEYVQAETEFTAIEERCFANVTKLNVKADEVRKESRKNKNRTNPAPFSNKENIEKNICNEQKNPVGISYFSNKERKRSLVRQSVVNFSSDRLVPINKTERKIRFFDLKYGDDPFHGNF